MITAMIHQQFKTRGGTDTGRLRIAIVEVGSGHGKLSYLLAKSLKNTSPFFEDQKVEFSVICTDFHDGTFTEIMRLPWVV